MAAAATAAVAATATATVAVVTVVVAAVAAAAVETTAVVAGIALQLVASDKSGGCASASVPEDDTMTWKETREWSARHDRRNK